MSIQLTPFQQLQLLDAGFRQHAAALPARQENREQWSGIGFRIGQHYYVAPMEEVAEILPEPQSYTQLPGVKDWVRGVSNVRGRLLPLIDLCAFLGEPSSSQRKLRRVLVVERQGVFAGLTVDAVLGMQHFEAGSFFAQVQEVPDSIRPYVKGTLQRERNWVLFSPFILAESSRFMDVVA